MLIGFSLGNWKSFRDKATFTMIATKDRQLENRLLKIEKHGIRVLPVAAIYGGNASGKTNFFKAMNFAKTLIVKGTQPDGHISVEPFMLDQAFSRPDFLNRIQVAQNGNSHGR